MAEALAAILGDATTAVDTSADNSAVDEEIVDGAGTDESEVTDDSESADGGEQTDDTDQESGDDTVDPDTGKVDGRKIEAKLRTALAEIAKTDPTAAKALRESYFQNQAFLKAFPEAKTAGEALKIVSQMKTTLDTLGGEAGIEELQTEVGDYRKEIDQFSKGDVALLKNLNEANPESFAKMTSNAIELLRSSNPEAYQEALIPSIAGVMEGLGLNSSIVKLANLVKDGKGQEAYDLIREMATVLNNVKTAAAERGKAQKIDPRQTALDAKEKELNDKAEKSYQDEINRGLDRANNAVIAKLADPVVKQLKLGDEGKRDFINGFNQKVWAAMKNDKAWQKQAQAVMAKRDPEKTASFVAAKFAELAPSIFIKHRNALYPNLQKASTPASKEKGTTAAVKAVPGRVYERSQVDIANTPDELLINSKAFLKGTKTIVRYKQ